MDARRAAAIVRGDILIARRDDASWSCAVDTPAWFAWLEGVDAFAFAGPEGTFSARKERPGGGRGGGYWRAYRKRGGHLRRAYLGRSASVTLARLRAAAAALATAPDDTGSGAAAPGAAPGRRRPGVRGAPAFLTSFVGREREQAELAARLATTRLLTVTGPGGVGKTRLALAVAGRLVDAYDDGVVWVELAPLDDPALVPRAVAAALGVREAPGRSIGAALAAALQSRRLLLALDNCEHLVPACAALAGALLAACPGLRVLATSRQALGVAGEAIWSAPPLGLPPRAADRPLAEVAAAEAVRLFRERAAAAEPRFAVTERNAPAVVDLCWRLDGVPLALELAAARARVLTVEQIAARLDDAFRLLSGGSSPLPRQRTLRATLDWSHGLLTEPERGLFRRLAVFAGGWTIEAAEAVCAGDGIAGAEVLDLLSGLVDKSLAQAEPGPDGATRYRLLETVRQYAAERLDEAGEAASVHRRHADYVLVFTERAEPLLFGSEQLTWFGRLDADHDNVRAALAWALEHEPDRGLQIAGSLWPFWQARWHYREAQGWLERLLEAAPGSSRWRARALMCLGRLALEQGDPPAAAALLEAGLALARALDEPRLVAWALRELTMVCAINLGDLARARVLIDEGEPLSRALGDPAGLAAALIARGRVEWGIGAYGRARAALEEAVALARRVGDRALLGDALGWLSGVVQGEGDYPAARALGEEALAIAEDQGATWTVMRLRWSLANVVLDEGDHARAAALFAAGLTLARQRQDTFWQAFHLGSMGRQALLQGDAARATTLLEEGLALHTGMGNERSAATVRRILGLAVWRRGDAERGLTLLRASLAAYRAIGDPAGSVAALEALATVVADAGRAAVAARWLGAAEAARERAGTPRPPVDRPGHEATVAAARAALGEAAFAAAWAEGLALPLDEAIEEALAPDEANAGLPRPAGTTPGDGRAVAVAAPPPADGLTRREAEVLRLIAAGRSNRAIAAELALSVRTVERHITNLYGKIDARGRADATAYAFRHSLA